jgi:hypothetical protein
MLSKNHLEIGRKTRVIAMRNSVPMLSEFLMCQSTTLFDILGAAAPFTSRWISLQFSALPSTLIGAVF